METIQGVRTKLVLVSGTHGAIRVPLAQSFNYTPKITERTINEFDNLEAALVVTTFDGVDVTFDYLDSDSKLVDASFADVNPASAVIVDDPSDYQQVNLFANMKSLSTGKIFASILAKGCRCKGAPYTEPVKEEARISRDLSGTNVLKIKGAAILYTRILANTPNASVYDQAIPPNAYADQNFSGYSGGSGVSGYSGARIALAKTALVSDGASGYALYVLKNGVEAEATGYTMTSTTFEAIGEPLTTDVWEVFSLYADS